MDSIYFLETDLMRLRDSMVIALSVLEELDTLRVEVEARINDMHLAFRMSASYATSPYHVIMERLYHKSYLSISHLLQSLVTLKLST